MAKKNYKNKKTKKSKGRNLFHPSPRPYNLAPPTYVAQPVRSMKIRASVTGAALSSATLQYNDLAGFLGVIATSATTSVFICDQFKLVRICAWVPVSTAGTAVSVMLKYVDDPASNTQSGPPRTVQDSSISYDRPAYACLEPPTDNSSIYSQWFDSSLTTGAVVINCNAGAVLDFWFQWILDDIGAPSAGPTLVGATAGIIYHHTITKGGATIVAVPPLNAL